MLSSHYHHHKSKTFSQLTQCPFTGTLLLLLNIEQKYVYESHFQFQDLPHVRRANNFTAHLQAYEIPDFICFKAPVTGSDFYKWSHHYKLGPFFVSFAGWWQPQKVWG